MSAESPATAISLAFSQATGALCLRAVQGFSGALAESQLGLAAGVARSAVHTAPLAHLLSIASSSLSETNAIQYMEACEKLGAIASGAELCLIRKDLVVIAKALTVLTDRFDVGDRVTMVACSLAMALARYDAHAATITPLHAALVQIALKRVTTPAILESVRAVLDLDLHDVSKAKEFGTTATDVLQYLFYGAKLYCKLKLWSSARALFRACLALPGIKSTPLQEAAWKHLLLVEVIANGPAADLKAPAPMSASLAKALQPTPRSVMDTYHTLASEAAKNNTGEAVRDLAAKFHEHLVRDDTSALFEEVLAATTRFRLRRLGDIYKSISLAEACRELGVTAPQLEGLVAAMTHDGELRASIDAAAGALRFSANAAIDGAAGDAAAAAEAQVLQKVFESTRALVERLRVGHEALHLSKAYLVKAATAAKRSASGGGGGGGGGAGGYMGGDSDWGHLGSMMDP